MSDKAACERAGENGQRTVIERTFQAQVEQLWNV
jgi:hypothetical protein